METGSTSYTSWEWKIDQVLYTLGVGTGSISYTLGMKIGKESH